MCNYQGIVGNTNRRERLGRGMSSCQDSILYLLYLDVDQGYILGHRASRMAAHDRGRDHDRVHRRKPVKIYCRFL